jgi:hypothetical protein
MRARLLLISLTACKASIGDGMADGSVGSDGSANDMMMATLGPWSAPTPIDIAPVDDDDPTATGDLLELYFNRSGDIFVSKRASVSDPWGTPVAVVELDSADYETTPEVTYDGLTIYFASSRAGTLGDNDIWRSTRTSRTAAWSSPVHVNELCSTVADGSPNQTDPLTILIDTNRAGATLLDVFIATRTQPTGAFGSPVAIDELNSPQSEGNPMFGAGTLSVYFDSNRSGGGELYIATRASTSEPFGAPSRISELGSTGNEADAWISPDGRTLYFTSDRDGTLRLWQTTR